MLQQKSILVVTPFFRPSLGGAETYVNELCEYFRIHDYYVHVLTYQPIIVSGIRGKPFEKLKNIDVRRFWWIGHDLFHKLQKYPFLVSFYVIPYLFSRCLLWMFRSHQKVNIIDAQGLNAAFIARVLKLIFKKKAVVSILALYNFVPGNYFARLVKWTLSGLDLVLVEKGKSEDELLSIGVPKNKLVIFNQWVDQNRFKPVDKKKAKENLGWENKFIILFVGRAIAEKGAAILLKASRKVNQNIVFVFITGKSPATHEIVKESELRKNINFLGEIDPDNLHKYYQAADIFCLPSIYEEGVARVIPEAISCGTPIVASDKGSIPYVLDPKVSILIEPTVDNFAKSIEYLYNNPEKLRLMTENCWSYALENFGEKNISMIGKAYQNLM